MHLEFIIKINEMNETVKLIKEIVNVYYEKKNF